MDWLKERLKDVRVIRGDPDFDFQTWVIDALRLIRESEEVEIETASEKAIRLELGLEKERWEVAEETIEERIFMK